jgi:hypothetical protein
MNRTKFFLPLHESEPLPGCAARERFLGEGGLVVPAGAFAMGFADSVQPRK